MTIKPDSPLKVGDWQYLPEQDKLVQFAADGKIAVTADLDNLSQKVANYFIVRAGKLVTKDELLQDVWGIRDVSDGRVTRVIRVLRVALGDDTREPRYIETIPKRGYRFIAPVTEIVEPATSVTAEDEEGHDADNAHRVNKSVVAYVGLFALFISLSWILWPASESLEEQAPIPMLRYTPLTSLDGLEFYHNISNDERYLAYSYASPAAENLAVLMLQDLEKHRRVQITDTSYNSFGSVFNPQGNKLAYHRMYNDGRCEIRIITLDLQALAPTQDDLLSECGMNSISSRISWSPDGNYVVYPTMSPQKQMVIMLKPVRGGNTEQLTVPPPSSFGDYVARFSKNGSKIVFLRDAAGAAQLWVLDLSSRETQKLATITDIMPGNVDWDIDDRYIVYPSGPTTLSRVDVASGETEVIAYTDYTASEIQISRSGIAYASIGNFSHINIKKVPNILLGHSALPETVFSSNKNETLAEVSPIPGDPIAVVSRRSGIPQVWLFYPDGNQKQVTFFKGNERFRNLAFSPNGQSLIAQVNNEIWLLGADKEPRKLISGDGNLISSPVWGASGNEIFYAESKNARWNIIRLSLKDETLTPITFAENRELYIESYDGTYSIWRDGISKRFYVYWKNLDKVEELPIILPENQQWLKFQLVNGGIYFSYLLDDIHYKLKFYNFENATLTDAIESTLYHSRFSLSPDQKSVYILQSVRGDFDIAKIALP